MTTHKVAVIMTGAVALSVAAASAHAENPFELNILSQGYQVADASASNSKAKEGKCSAGQCGSSMKPGNTSGKTKEGACHHEKAKEGACSADKMKAGSCSADKMKEGSCHASK